ncbi:uncharacterized protein LOC127874385 [Dreissena polymorpha]|uniref:uncharacterized protein LOC127874385 n=1 Tax=Dreissena polymorpha TaxID=45954 RepID=UPI0022653B23|nr:uncharacterized protein LOC127874385 [Dreissena polymorpha]
MPTSSQALILKKSVLTEDEVRPTSSGHRPGSQCSVPTDCASRTSVHCSIVTVFNLGQVLVGVGRDMPDRDAVQALGASLRNFSNIKLYQGVTPASSHSIQTRNPICDAATPNDLACPDANVIRSDKIYQIASSLHMRNDTPPSCPNAAVLSFWNNENVSHSEIGSPVRVPYPGPLQHRDRLQLGAGAGWRGEGHAGPGRCAGPWALDCAALQTSPASEWLHQHPRIRPGLEILSVACAGRNWFLPGS